MLFRNHQETHTIHLGTHPRCSFGWRTLWMPWGYSIALHVKNGGVSKLGPLPPPKKQRQREMRWTCSWSSRVCFHVLIFFGRHILKKQHVQNGQPPTPKKKNSWWCQPSLKKNRQIWIFPKVRGENKKYLSCHHLKHQQTIPPELLRIALRLPLRGSLPPVAGPAIARQPWQWLQG